MFRPPSADKINHSKIDLLLVLVLVLVLVSVLVLVLVVLLVVLAVASKANRLCRQPIRKIKISSRRKCTRIVPCLRALRKKQHPYAGRSMLECVWEISPLNEKPILHVGPRYTSVLVV